MLTVTAVPAFVDNYIWVAARAGYAVVIDPGDARPVLAMLASNHLKLAAILITHHHPDHCGGVMQIVAAHPAPVYGPRAEAARIAGLTQLVDDGDHIEIAELDFKCDVLFIPGHTRGHIAYYSPRSGGDPPRLFCGDTMFSAGCGRLFEGTAAQLHGSLQKLNAFDADTEVYCMHEYTQSNLVFAQAAEPGNPAVEEYLQQVRDLRARNLPSLPSTLGRERRVNPFLRVGEPAIMNSTSRHAGQALEEPVAVFAALRQWKDGFRAP